MGFMIGKTHFSKQKRKKKKKESSNIEERALTEIY
jgi:hypothetical protein